MSAVLILLIAFALLALGYIFYGSWVAKQWGVDPTHETPAHTSYDGKDFVPANPAVLMGHHFSSIAGAGPINGPIQAAVFGWVPVFLWIVIGGIFFGAVHDFGALFASIRHNGGSIGEVIKEEIGVSAQRLFTIFALLVLILVIASFTAVVAGTFVSVGADGAALPLFTVGRANVSGNASTAMTSLLFIVIAFIFGFFVYRKNCKIGPATIVAIFGIIAIVAIGLNVGINCSRTFWVLFIAVYVTVASLLPVWMLLQPRDYLSSFLLYGMMIVAAVGVLFSGAKVELPAFAGWTGLNQKATLFPTLFITVACGAVSGFHALIGSGTTSKQLDSEKDAKVIGYGAMIVESALAVIALIAVGVIFKETDIGGGDLFKISAPPTIFAGGVATMVATMFHGAADFSNPVYDTTYSLLTLAVSVFALTSLDSGCRLSRYMFAELFIPEGKTREDLTGVRKFFSHPMVSTVIMVVIGCGMGFMGLSQIWGVFGAANQLLAGIAMLAVAAWLGNIGKNNKMFFVPMVFMLCATITSLTMTVIAKIKMIAGATAAWGDWFQMIWSIGLVVLAIILVVQGVKTLTKKGEKKEA
ncbi:MAG: carbon starvation protein A [Oscillospiraceae bacterium]|nr:carbon starvation protein A [Oscillospiraceae bacterium]